MKESRNVGMLRLRHLFEVTEATAEEMQDQAERFSRLSGNDAAPRVVSSHNLFQTPEDIANRLVSMVPVGRTLEPSAGLGRIYKAIRARSKDSDITLVEVAADCCRELYLSINGDESAVLVQADFLSIEVERLGLFDAIVMNPPFERGSDIKHIEHAKRFLADGGTLVSVCAAGPRQRKHFSDCEWIDLPKGSFRSEGTGVDAAIVILRK